MLDLGWGELLLIAIVAILVIGPRDLPLVLRSAGRFAARIRELTLEFKRTIDAAADAEEIRRAREHFEGALDIEITEKPQPPKDEKADG